jgi:hypothetical protein
MQPHRIPSDRLDLAHRQATYMAAVAQTAVGMGDPTSLDTIECAFGVTPVPAGIDARDAATEHEVAAVRAIVQTTVDLTCGGYVVVVNLPGFLPEQEPVVVGTLEEAQIIAHDEVGRSYDGLPLDAEWSSLHDRVDALPADGGVIGPLPDGYVIDVTKAV